jgi:hypothetical protein
MPASAVRVSAGSAFGPSSCHSPVSASGNASLATLAVWRARAYGLARMRSGAMPSAAMPRAASATCARPPSVNGRSASRVTEGSSRGTAFP